MRYILTDFDTFTLRGRVKPKFLGKLSLKIGVYVNAPPIGGYFDEVSESLHLLRSARRPRPEMGVAWSYIQLCTPPTI